MCGSRGGDRGSGPSLKNHKHIGVLSNTGLDSLNNHKATKPAFTVGPYMAFRWRAYDGPLIVVFESFLPSSN